MGCTEPRLCRLDCFFMNRQYVNDLELSHDHDLRCRNCRTAKVGHRLKTREREREPEREWCCLFLYGEKQKAFSALRIKGNIYEVHIFNINIRPGKQVCATGVENPYYE